MLRLLYPNSNVSRYTAVGIVAVTNYASSVMILKWIIGRIIWHEFVIFQIVLVLEKVVTLSSLSLIYKCELLALLKVYIHHLPERSSNLVACCAVVSTLMYVIKPTFTYTIVLIMIEHYIWVARFSPFRWTSHRFNVYLSHLSLVYPSLNHVQLN